MECSKCGAQLAEEAKFCHECGEQASAGFAPNVSEPQSTAVDPRNFPVPRSAGKDDAELELWQGTYSPKAMLGTWLLGGLVAIAAVGDDALDAGE